MRGIIIGGGIGGLTTAISLKRIGINIKLFEVNKSLNCHSSIYIGLWNTSLKILEKLELKNNYKEMIQPVIKSGFKDIYGDILAQPLYDLKLPPNHPSLGFINQNYLLNTLYEEVKEDVYLGSKVNKIYRNHAECVVEIEGQEPHYADFIVSADGIDSIGKKTALGIDTIPKKYRGYKVYRGHTSKDKLGKNIDINNFESFQTLGIGSRFAAVPTINGIAWFAAITDQVLESSKKNSNSNIEHLSNIYQSWHDPILTLIQNVDQQENGIHIEDIYQSELKYQGWDAILKFSNNTTAPSPDDPLTLMPTATEDAKKMGYQSSNTTTSTTSTSSTSSNPLNPNNVTYRDALASGMWRVRTAPFVFYIGDSAYTMDPILAQGAGLAIEGAYGLSQALKDYHPENSNINFDEIMPELMECENQRYFRYLTLKRISTVVDTFGNTSSPVIYNLRNKLLRNTPKRVKGLFFNYLIEKSLYY